MQTAYDPVAVRRLRAHTVAAIDALSVLRSSDVAAQDAVAAIRLVRRNLEDLWMPLLQQIEASTALLRWNAGLATSIEGAWQSIDDWIGWLDDGRRKAPAPPLAGASDDDLLAAVFFFDETKWVRATDDGTTVPPADFMTLASQLGRRVRTNPDFAYRLLELADDHEAIAFAVGAVDFPPAFVRDVAISMLHNLPILGGELPSLVRITAYRQVLTELATHPAMSLELLQDERSLFMLSIAPMLDQAAVADVVTSGLHTAVAENPALLVEGYGVLRQLTEMAGDTFDDGFGAGLAQGVATSMLGYVSTLAPAIVKEDGGAVRVVTFDEHAFEFDLGSYEDVRTLFGSVARDTTAQATLGVVLGAYTNSVVDLLGESIHRRSGIQHVAQFADLLGDAVNAEQGEMIAAAAAASSRRELLADGVGFAAGAALGATGVGATTSAVATRLVRLGASAFTEIEPDSMPNGALRHVAHDSIVVAAIGLARTDGDMQRARNLDADDPDDLRRVDDYLARIDEFAAVGDTHAYRTEVADMTAFIRAKTPALDEFLTAITDIAAINELTEGHS